MKNCCIKLLLSLISLVFTQILQAQNKIRFDYDLSGNQIKRELCLNCLGKQSKDLKEISNLKEEDLTKLNEEDNISYYPNPIKEELFIKWEIIDNSTVSNVEVFNINGQLVKSYNNLETLNKLNLPFIKEPAGTYIISLKYSNGEKKGFKIVKK